jgi:hypothetical protein
MAKRRNPANRAPGRTQQLEKSESSPVKTNPAAQAKHTTWTLLAILTVAAGLRFWSLNAAPPGIYHDEAVNGLQGLEAAQTGHFKVFYPENNGREGLLINLTGLAEKVMGPSAFSLRLWPAILGTLTVLGVFILARDLFGSDSIGLLSAFFIATSFWHLNFSRIAFAGIQMPFFLSWGIWTDFFGSNRSQRSQRSDESMFAGSRRWSAFWTGLPQLLAVSVRPVPCPSLFDRRLTQSSPGAKEVFSSLHRLGSVRISAGVPARTLFLAQSRGFLRPSKPGFRMEHPQPRRYILESIPGNPQNV